MTIATEDFWDDLLDLIDAGHVLPIVGQGVTTIGPDDAQLACRVDQTETLGMGADVAHQGLPIKPREQTADPVVGKSRSKRKWPRSS